MANKQKIIKKFIKKERKIMKKIKENRTEIIHFRVSKSEYEQIKNNADRQGQSPNVYARECTLNPYSLSVNYDEIEEHTKQITETKQSVNLLIGTLVKSGNYYPSDVENLSALLKDISDSEAKLIKLFCESEIKLRKELKKIISENLRKEV